eukprot:g7526.t1
MELCVVGLSEAGKTSLVNVLSSGEFKEDVIPTVGFSMRRIKKGGVSMKIWDLGGQRRFRGMWERYCRGVEAIVFVVDASSRNSIPQAEEALIDLLEKQALIKIPLLVLGNKMDLPDAITANALAQTMKLNTFEKDRKIGYYGISCKTKANINAVLEWLIQRSK